MIKDKFNRSGKEQYRQLDTPKTEEKTDVYKRQACDVIDLIIEILRGSKSRDQVKKCLTDGITEGIKFKTKTSEKAAKTLKFTEKQADVYKRQTQGG